MAARWRTEDLRAICSKEIRFSQSRARLVKIDCLYCIWFLTSTRFHKRYSLISINFRHVHKTEILLTESDPNE